MLIAEAEPKPPDDATAFASTLLALPPYLVLGPMPKICWATARDAASLLPMLRKQRHTGILMH